MQTQIPQMPSNNKKLDELLFLASTIKSLKPIYSKIHLYKGSKDKHHYLIMVGMIDKLKRRQVGGIDEETHTKVSGLIKSLIYD